MVDAAAVQPRLPARKRRQAAIALKHNLGQEAAPRVVAKGYGAVAEKIIKLAFENDVEALLQLRRFVDFIPSNNREKAPVRPTVDPVDRDDYSLDTLVPDNPNKPYDVKELIPIARVATTLVPIGVDGELLTVDGSRIAVDAGGRTTLPDVWAGGDCAATGGVDLTVQAVQDGKVAAASIDAYLASLAAKAAAPVKANDADRAG